METNPAQLGCRSGLSRPYTHDQTFVFGYDEEPARAVGKHVPIFRRLDAKKQSPQNCAITSNGATLKLCELLTFCWRQYRRRISEQTINCNHACSWCAKKYRICNRYVCKKNKIVTHPRSNRWLLRQALVILKSENGKTRSFAKPFPTPRLKS